MKRKLWFGLLSAALLFLFTYDVFAATGGCGDGLTYDLDYTNRSLTITYNGSGSGKMTDYSTYTSPYGDMYSTAPWGVTRPTSIEIGEGVTSIGDNAFLWCSGLKNITIPSSVTSIGEYAFGYCSGLTNLTLPSGLTYLGNRAFHNCACLVRVELPSTLTSIGYYIFIGCERLTDVFFDGTEKQWENVGKDERWRNLSTDFNLHFRCIVSYDANGHGTTEMKKYWENTTISDAKELQADGFVFNGWYKDETCKEKWDFDKDLVSGDMTLYAGWKAEQTSAPQTDTDDSVSVPSSTKIVTPALLVKMAAKGSNNLVISWNKIAGAKGYDIFFAKCGKNDRKTKLKKVKTVKGKALSWTKTGLKKNTAYKARVKAWVKKNGKKTYILTSPAVHAYTSNGTKKFTNPKSVTVKKKTVKLAVGKTSKIKANVIPAKKGKTLIGKNHAPKLRYVSSNKKVATVSSSGKIKAKSTGNCKIYVYAVNGVRAAVTVKVS